MCNHNPITIHEHGGTCVICANCLRILKPWRARGEAGQVLPAVLVSAGIATFWAAIIWLVFNATAPEAGMKAILAAVVTWLTAFGVSLYSVSICMIGSRNDHDGEVE